LKITFTEREMELLRVLAKGRHFLKDQAKPNRRDFIWGNSNERRDLIGVMGEYAVSKALKIPMDMSCGLEGDGGTDLMMDEYNVDVKTTKYKTGRLVFNLNDELKADVYILCWAIEEQAEVILQGYIRKQSMAAVMVKQNLGHGMRNVIDQRHLKPISLLLAYREKK
jgi:hypothetical protein